MKIENPELFLLKITGKIIKETGETSESNPNRLNIIYKIRKPISGLICGNGSCAKTPVWLLYMRDHRKQETWSAYCKDHPPQMLRTKKLITGRLL